MLFAEILRVGYFPMIAGHENRMDDCHYVFHVYIGQNFSEPQLVQTLANFFRLLYNVLMRHLLSWWTLSGVAISFYHHREEMSLSFWFPFGIRSFIVN